MKSGFVNIFGQPNVGKSTLLNKLIGEKLAIVTAKVQTTRHRIKGILNTKDYQIVFSDTPGIIEPTSKLQETMMGAVASATEDADVIILVHDLTRKIGDVVELFSKFKRKAPVIVVLNKTDLVDESVIQKTKQFLNENGFDHIHTIAAASGAGVPELIALIADLLPEGAPFYSTEDLTDLPVRFFVSEIIREKIFNLFREEIPYHSTVVIREFTEKDTLTKIRAEIIVQRETQKSIIIGHKGNMIKTIGTQARKEIEEFIGRKVFLDLMVKVRSKWRDNDIFLREYGYK